MYADIDSRGLVSLLELSTIDVNALMEAMVQYREKLQATIDLLGGNEYTWSAIASIDRMILELRQITRER